MSRRQSRISRNTQNAAPRRRPKLEQLESRDLFSAIPLGASSEDTGEFFLGRVAVVPVLFESNGTIDTSTQKWTPAEIDFAIETVTAPIAAHEWMLTELTRNLLHNAVLHTPSSGSLTVRIVRDSTHAALTLSDSGPGIDAELAQRLFQPFSSGHVARGSGLGLAICKEIVQVLKGTISLDNRVQHGLVAGLDATVRLPLFV